MKTNLAIGIILSVMGAAFLIAAIAVARMEWVTRLHILHVFGFLIAALAAFLFGGKELYTYHSAQRLKNLQLTAPARIVSISQTGTRVNQSLEYNIQLEVMPPGKPAFQSRAVQVLSFPRVAQISLPGSVVQVLYDPNKPDRVMLN
jgi:hypothetical protein